VKEGKLSFIFRIQFLPIRETNRRKIHRNLYWDQGWVIGLHPRIIILGLTWSQEEKVFNPGLTISFKETLVENGIRGLVKEGYYFQKGYFQKKLGEIFNWKPLVTTGNEQGSSGKRLEWLRNQAGRLGQKLNFENKVLHRIGTHF